MNPNGEMPEATKPHTACYRLGRSYLVLGVVSTMCFLSMDVSFVYVAYWNVDGSFPHPKLHALVHGVFWSCWTLFGLWLIVAYFRERLFVTMDAITQHGCIVRRRINVPDVIQIVWKGIPQVGKIIIRSHFTKIKIDLGNYTCDQRNALIQFFHGTFPIGIQDGWPRFAEFRQPTKAPTQQDSLRAALICALLLLAFGTIFIFCWVFDLGIQWLVIGLVNVLAGLWYLWRRYHYRIQMSPEKPAEQSHSLEPATGSVSNGESSPPAQ